MTTDNTLSLTGEAIRDRTADRELVTIYEISKILTAPLDFHAGARQLLAVLTAHLGMRHGLIALAQDDGQLRVYGATGPVFTDAPLVLDTDQGLFGRVLKNNSPMVVPDITREPLFVNRTGRDLTQSAGVALVAVPIRDGRQAIGLLSVDRLPEDDRPVRFDRDVRILTLVANLLGQSWRLHRKIAAEREAHRRETRRLKTQLKGRYQVDNVVGMSKRMQEVLADVHQAAPGHATVLLRGESGTGKEAIAHAIHYLSPRAKSPFVKVNCAALPETLLESELFGHEKGAFTGATSERKGRFELAEGGTLFLDEIGDITPTFQAKLLRVLQEHEFERVGGNKTLKANFRLVAATNRNLEEMVQKGEFRADLYFRLNVVTLFLPALRERKDDIPLLVEHFLARFNKDNDRTVALEAEAMDLLLHCNWPGNVRELQNCIERAATMTRGDHIRADDLRCFKGQCFSSMLLNVEQNRCAPGGTGAAFVAPPHPAGPSSALPTPPTFPITMPPRHHPATAAPEHDGDGDEEFALPGDGGMSGIPEREQLVAAMEKCGWVQAKAARLLNLTPRQIGYALKKHRIAVKRL